MRSIELYEDDDDLSASTRSVLEGAPLAPSERRSLRRRRLLAHALGWSGVLFTVALAWLAFGKRAVELVTVPPPAPGTLAPVVSALTPLVSALTPTARVPAPAPPPPPRDSASASVEAPLPPVPTRAATPEVHAERATASVPPPASAPLLAFEPPPAPRARNVEPPLTPAEIQARKERYARWLSEQGLSHAEDPEPNATP